MNRYDKIVRNLGIVIFVIMLISSFLMGNNSVGSDNDQDQQGPVIFKDAPVQRSTAADNDYLTSGQSFTIAISEKDGEVIRNFTARLSWTDETNPPDRPHIRRYENLPDTFSLRIVQPDGNSTDIQDANPAGRSGSLEIPISLKDEYLSDLYGKGIAGNGNWTVEVTLISAGRWTTALGFGFMDIPDEGNDFSLSIDYEYYDMSPDEGEGN
jgi:hypothetical protein